MKILVTGASGFLGGHLCERLLAAGHAVRALVRPTSDVSVLRPLGVELAVGAVDERPSLDAAVEGVDAIVHAAGLTKARALADFERVNVGGTENVLDAVRGSGIELRRFVYVSSLAVTGPSDGPWPPPRDRPPAPITTYGRTKAAGEALVLGEARTLPVTSIRPPTIYGPRDRDSFLALFRSVARGLRPVFTGKGAVSTIHAADCAAAIDAILSGGPPSGRVYAVDDGPPHGLDELGHAIEAAVGRRALRIPVPRWMIRPAAALTEAVARIRGEAVLFTWDKAPEIAARWWISGHEAITRDLGWEPAVSLEQGCAETATWYRENGWM